MNKAISRDWNNPISSQETYEQLKELKGKHGTMDADEWKRQRLKDIQEEREKDQWKK